MNEMFLARGKLKYDNLPHKKGDWVYGNYIEIKDWGLTVCCIYGYGEIIPETVGRCTGLTDKNDTLIFEGDIVKGVVLSSEFIGDIVWIEEIASFGIGHRGKREPTAWENSSLFKRLRLGYKDQFAAEIIGNIHDNPELIGGN